MIAFTSFNLPLWLIADSSFIMLLRQVITLLISPNKAQAEDPCSVCLLYPRTVYLTVKPTSPCSEAPPHCTPSPFHSHLGKSFRLYMSPDWFPMYHGLPCASAKRTLWDWKIPTGSITNERTCLLWLRYNPYAHEIQLFKCEENVKNPACCV